jgi:hypothetical protein
MTRTIRASYVWTADMMVAAQEAHYRRIFRKPFRWAWYGVFGLLGVLGVAALFTPDWPIGVALVLLAAFVTLFARSYRAWKARRQFRSGGGDRDSKVEWLFEEDRVTIRSMNTDSSVRWPAFVRFFEASDGFLLYTSDRLFHYIPRIAFDPDDLAEFVELARSKVGPRPPMVVPADPFS